MRTGYGVHVLALGDWQWREQGFPTFDRAREYAVARQMAESPGCRWRVVDAQGTPVAELARREGH